jgi:hypothetical protein
MAALSQIGYGIFVLPVAFSKGSLVLVEPFAGLSPIVAPTPIAQVASLLTSTGTLRHAPGNGFVQLEFSTRVDGITEAKPVSVLVAGKTLMTLPVNQPSYIRELPHSVPVELVVIGEGDKRTEVWGPFTFPKQARWTLTGIAPDGEQGVPYDHSFTSSFYDPPAQWTYTGTLPSGLTLDDERLYGTPTVAGIYRFTVSVVLGNGAVRYLDNVVEIV